MAHSIVAQSQPDTSLATTPTPTDDEVLLLIAQRAEEALAALWLSDLPKPRALFIAEQAVSDLTRYIQRNKRGRAQVRARLLRRYSGEATDPQRRFGKAVASDLTRSNNAMLVVPGLLAALSGSTSDLEPDGYAEAVDDWLSADE